jgi:hypothetical protein
MGDMRKAYKILIGKPEGKRPLGRPKCRKEDNIKMDITEIKFGVWLDSTGSEDQWRGLVNTVMNVLAQKKKAGNFLTS